MEQIKNLPLPTHNHNLFKIVDKDGTLKREYLSNPGEYEDTLSTEDCKSQIEQQYQFIEGRLQIIANLKYQQSVHEEYRVDNPLVEEVEEPVDDNPQEI